MSDNKNEEKMVGNKGEWSEIYAFMKLLSQGRVYAANEKLEKTKTKRKKKRKRKLKKN